MPDLYAFKLPDVGEGVAQAELVELKVAVGDVVREDMTLAEVMTDKATVEIPSPVEGRIEKIHGEPGDTLSVGSVFIEISTDAPIGNAKAGTETDIKPDTENLVDAAAQTDTKKDRRSPDKENEKAPSAEQEKARNTGPEGKKILASPAVRARAEHLGIDFGSFERDDPDTPISHQELDDYLVSASGQMLKQPMGSHIFGEDVSAPDKVRGKKIIGLRRKIAQRMARANIEVPHITIIEEVDVTQLTAIRAKLNEKQVSNAKRTGEEVVKLTLLPFLVKAICTAVKDTPHMNAHFHTQSDRFEIFDSVHIGIATQTEKGLMVPVIRNAQNKKLDELAGEIEINSKAARDGSAEKEILSGSTLTVTSLGPLGALATTPIINQPEVAIIGVNRMRIMPRWNGETFEPGQVMNISSSFDHRVIDGWEAAQFVARLKELLEDPLLIFV